MGVETVGFLEPSVTALEVFQAVQNLVDKNAKMSDTSFEGFCKVAFEYNGEHRAMSVFEQSSTEKLSREPQTKTLTYLGASGCASEVTKKILAVFGGAFMENDCNGADDVSYISPTAVMNLTPEQQVQNKLLEKLNDSKLFWTDKMRIVDFVRNNLDFIKSL